MSTNANLLQCFHKGCGKTFDPDNNSDDACCYHPGSPVFHDAYKGWSCCNKKCTDFTEFLNIKGCSYSKHSNVKPIEPEKPAPKIDLNKDVIEVKPMVHSQLKRPPIDTPLVIMNPEIAQSLKAIESVISDTQNSDIDDTVIKVGTSCKNSGCNRTYQDSKSDDEQCTFHSGSPIFHEGMKYWSCCQRKTTDFTVFLNQPGCQTGKHIWKKDETNDKTVDCRWDWHQTASHVVVAIYAKQYCPKSSIIQLNPIRILTSLVFPQQAHATFTLDIELQGIIDIKASQVAMYGTKVEIKLRKAEPGTWARLEVPKRPEKNEKVTQKVEKLTPKIEAVDLSDL